MFLTFVICDSVFKKKFDQNLLTVHFRRLLSVSFEFHSASLTKRLHQT